MHEAGVKTDQDEGPAVFDRDGLDALVHVSHQGLPDLLESPRGSRPILGPYLASAFVEDTGKEVRARGRGLVQLLDEAKTGSQRFGHRGPFCLGGRAATASPVRA